MTHHSIMMSSLRIKIFRIDKFGDFSCDVDYSIMTDLFRDVIPLIIKDTALEKHRLTLQMNLEKEALKIQSKISL